MSNLYNDITELCKKAGITVGKMCNDLGISRGIMSDLKAERKKSISHDTAEKIAQYFSVPTSYLLGEKVERQEHEPTDFYTAYLRLCNQRGISPTAAAVNMGFSRSMVTRWKDGTVPRSASLRKIADYFGVSVDTLLYGEQEEKESPATHEGSGEVNESARVLIDFALNGPLDEVDAVANFINMLRRKGK